MSASIRSPTRSRSPSLASPSCHAASSRRSRGETQHDPLADALSRLGHDDGASAEVPCLRLDRGEVEVADVDVPRIHAPGRQVAWLMAGAAVMELVTAAMGQVEGGVAL